MILPNEFIVLSAVIILGGIGFCGIFTGWTSSRLLGLRWSGRTWITDAALAVGLIFALALTFGWLTRGNGPDPGWLALVATLIAVLRHLGRCGVGRAPDPPAS